MYLQPICYLKAKQFFFFRTTCFLTVHTQCEEREGFWLNRNLRYGYELPLSLPPPEYCVYATLASGRWVDG